MLSLRPSRSSSYAVLSQIANVFSARKMRRFLCLQWTLTLMMVLGAGALQAQTVTLTPVISSVAGTGGCSSYGDNGPATSAGLCNPAGIVVDGAGNLYFADWEFGRIRKVTPDGTITTVAGNGTAGYNGDNIAATSAELNAPQGVAVDGAGNLYIADQDNNRIRKVMPGGIITTVAGNGTAGYNGDSIAATSAQLYKPTDIAVDGTGNLYIAEYWGNRIRMVTPGGTITTVAGNGTAGYNGDNIAATSAELAGPTGIAVAGGGNLYIADQGNHRIRMVTPGGIITTVAGNGTLGYNGDNIAATSAELAQAESVTVDGSGNLYIADQGNERIRKVTPGGIITTVAGNGIAGYSGDGFAAASAELNLPYGVTVDGSGNLYVADSINNRIRKVSGAAAPVSYLQTAIGSASASQNVLLAINSGLTISSISVPQSQGAKQEFTVGAITGCATDGVTTNAAGSTCTVPVTFQPGYPGLRQMPLAAQTSAGLFQFALEGTGNGPLVAFEPGTITTLAGNGHNGSYGDGGPATSALLYGPADVARDGSGNIYIADIDNQRIRKISPSGTITTVAGTGTPGYNGDNIAATSAELSYPSGVAVDGAGNLYIADEVNNRIRMVTPGGTITTVAGNGSPSCVFNTSSLLYTGGCSGGDGGPATSAELNYPERVAVDGAGNLYIADSSNNRIRKVTPGGAITTVAGNGYSGGPYGAGGYNGDNIAATSAELNGPAGLAVDSSGNLYIADGGNARIRMVTPGGTITTVAGNGTAGYNGDNIAATSAELRTPQGVAVDGSGNLYIVDTYNSRIRKVAPGGTITTVAGNGTNGYNGDNIAATSAELYWPYSVAVDSSGNLYIADFNYDRIRKVDVSDAPLLSFASTNVGQATASQDVTVLNLGNAPLTLSSISAAANFSLGGSDTSCSTSSPLAVAGNCILGIEFNPMVGGSISGSVIVTDNALNASAATQSIALQGTGIGQGPQTISVSSQAPSSAAYGSSFTVTATATSGQTVTYSVSGGVCSISGATVTMTSGSGTCTVQFNQSGNSNYSAAPQVTENVTATQAPLTVTANSASVVYGSPIPALTGTLTGVIGSDGIAASYATTAVQGSAVGTYPITATLHDPNNKLSNYNVTSTNGTLTITAPPVVSTTQSSMSFGSIAVGASAGSTQTLTFTVPSGITLGGISAVTQGAPNLDFTVTGGTCSSGTTNAACTVQVQFLPRAVGTRFGAVVLADQSGNTLITVPLVGIGTGSLVAFGPGTISTVAGNGTAGYNGDNIAASSAELTHPNRIAMDGAGNLYIADTNNARIRMVTPGGTITTVAGNGTAGYNGDNIAATSAELDVPYGVAVDGAGNLYIADENNQRIRMVTPSGMITTVAGNGYSQDNGVTGGYNGDNIPATSAELNSPWGITVDGAGNLYIADAGNARIRMVTPSGMITTVAGNGTAGYNGDNIAATSAELNDPAEVAVDGGGNLYITDKLNQRIRMVTPGGIITTVAGNGTLGYNGDNIAATSAELDSPLGLAVDAAGNLYFADLYNDRVRMVTPSGIITTVAGTGTGGYNGDNIAATSAELSIPGGIVLDGSGNLYIADETNYRIRKIDVSDAPSLTFGGTNVGAISAEQMVTVQNIGNAPLTFPVPVAGSNPNIPPYFTLDNSAATACPLVTTSSSAGSLASGASCTLSISFDPTFAGDYLGWMLLTDNALNAGSPNYATQAIELWGAGIGLQSQTITFPNPGTQTYGVAPITLGATASSMLPVSYTVTSGSATVSGGTLTITGPGMVVVQATQSGNGTYAAANPVFVSFWVAPALTSLSPTSATAGGAAFTLTVNGNFVSGAVVNWNGSALTTTYVSASQLTASVPASLIATAGTASVTVTANASTSGSFTFVIQAAQSSGTGAGIISTVAGNGTSGYSGDGGPATSAELSFPEGLAMDTSGNLYIADISNQRIRKVAPGGTITTVAGGGNSGLGDGGPATSSEFNDPEGVAVDASGNLYIADTQNNRIRKVTASTGVITTVAGNGTAGYSGDGGPATSAELSYPLGVAVDPSGNLYIADCHNVRIRKVTPSGTITTVAGGGNSGLGDSGPATSAELSAPDTVAVDSSGNLYIADLYTSRIRKVTASTGIITTVAGNGQQGYSGDGGPATSAELFQPFGVAVDASGNLYIADFYTNRVRMVTPGGTITTVAGNGYGEDTGNGGYSGDGGPATTAELWWPFGVAVDSSGNLYIADRGNQRIREVSSGTSGSLQSQTISFTNPGPVSYGVGPITLGATATSGLPVTYTVTSGPATVSGSTLTITGIGSVAVQAIQAGNDNYAAATPVSVTFAVNQAAQTINFPNPGPLTYGVGSVTLEATASSTLPVSYTVTSGPATVNGSTLTITGAGTVIVQATQAGNTNLTAAMPVSITVTVAQAPLTISPNSYSRALGAANPTFTGTVTGVVNNDLTTGNLVITYSTTAGSSSPIGTYPITAPLSGAAALNYALTVNPGTLSVWAQGVDLIESGVSLTGTLASGGTIQVADTATNQGIQSAGGSYTFFYLSSDGTTKGSMLNDRYVGTLATGASSSATTSMALPTNITGTNYVLVCANGGNSPIMESNTANDCTASAAFTVAGADLIESSVTGPTSGVVAGGNISVSDTTTNQGGGATSASYTMFYLSTDGKTKGAMLSYRSVAALAAGASSSATTSMTLPTNLAGSNYVLVCANGSNSPVVETNTANNCTASAAFTVAGADLIESSVTGPTTGVAGGNISVTDTTTNQGGGAASASYTMYYLSTDGKTKGTMLTYRSVAALAVGASSSATTSMTLPANITGTNYVLVCANNGGSPIVETNTANNCTASTAFAVAGADLIESSVTGPTSGVAGGTISVSDTTTNQGGGAASASYTMFYLSSDGKTKGAMLNYRSVAALAVGASSGATTSMTLPANITGTNYVLVCANNSASPIVETNTANNCTASAAFTVAGPDLIESSVAGPTTGVAGGAISVTDTTTNQGAGATSASYTMFYLSSDAKTKGTMLTYRSVVALAAGASSSATTSMTLPTNITGTQYVLVCANGSNSPVVETNTANDCTASAAFVITH